MIYDKIEVGQTINIQVITQMPCVLHLKYANEQIESGK